MYIKYWIGKIDFDDVLYILNILITYVKSLKMENSENFHKYNKLDTYN